MYCIPTSSSESLATLPPFGLIVGHKWFDHISNQRESQKNRFALIYFGKIQFFLPAFEISRSCRTTSVLFQFTVYGLIILSNMLHSFLQELLVTLLSM
jgi:hypothetical protein